jgi:hypothetical protein
MSITGRHDSILRGERAVFSSGADAAAAAALAEARRRRDAYLPRHSRKRAEARAAAGVPAS